MTFFPKLSFGLDKRYPLMVTVFFVLLGSSALIGESISTNLTDPIQDRKSVV